MTRPDWLWEINPFGKVPVLLYKVGLVTNTIMYFFSFFRLKHFCN